MQKNRNYHNRHTDTIICGLQTPILNASNKVNGGFKWGESSNVILMPIEWHTVTD